MNKCNIAHMRYNDLLLPPSSAPILPFSLRCAFSKWPYMPEEWRKTLPASPWLKMFQNARKWCNEHPRDA